MSRSHDDVVAQRWASLSTDRSRQREIFEHAYALALQIIDLPEKSGLASAQLAELSGVDQADIDAIERGSTSVSVASLQRLAGALDADVRLVERRS